jgi:hypothetical protein
MTGMTPGPAAPGTKTFSWDYEEQPPLDEIAEAVGALSGGSLRMVMPDTGSDQYELVITAPPLPAVVTQRDAYRDERDQAREVVAEILDFLGQDGHPDSLMVTEWRQRAGLEPRS